MTNTAQYTYGQRVKFSASELGTIDPAAPGRAAFTEHIVKRGMEGVIAVAPGSMPDGWIAVTPDEWPNEYVPVHPDMVEAI